MYYTLFTLMLALLVLVMGAGFRYFCRMPYVEKRQRGRE